MSVMESSQLVIAELMERSGVKFGTSGARGLAAAMTDRVCYAYTRAFMEHLLREGEIVTGCPVAIGGDFRPSSPRIMAAAAMAIRDVGCDVINCGFIPTPAVASYAMGRGLASLMVTGSHIPDDRNGIKFNKPGGEILKPDEQAISAATVSVPDLFDEQGMARAPQPLPEVCVEADYAYVHRYLDFFGAGSLEGCRVGVYQHSTVARDLMVRIFTALGATVTALGRSDTFIPVDTEAVRPEDVALAAQWAKEQSFDAIISADGDGDRPLVSDENGEWLRGDVAGVLCARYLQASHVATPVSSNSAVEKCGWFREVARTRIGSPFVIEAMNAMLGQGQVVGYEANGGFLLASDIRLGDRVLKALPTRDAVIVPLTILMLARRAGQSVSELLATLPPRYTSSDRLKEFPTELSQARLAGFDSGDAAADAQAIAAAFPGLGAVAALDRTDGLRITFDNAEVVHLRPSGNAPELRCYNEADSAERAQALNQYCLGLMSAWR